MELIKGNCLEKLKDIPDKSVDLAYMDLCYGQTACKWDKKFTKDEWVIFWKELKRVARNDRTPFFFSCTTKFGFDIIESNKKWFRWDLVWKKNRAAGFLNAYKLPMRKHEMIYCFSNKCPEYDVSSHSEYVAEKKTRGKSKMKVDLYHNNNVGVKSKTHKVPLPTSDITPPTEEHELVYCFAKKSPEYDVSSHKEYTEQDNKANRTNAYVHEGSKHKKEITAKLYKNPLPTSDITPPKEEHELVYCFSNKCPAYDVSSHTTGNTTEKKPSKGHTYIDSAIGHRPCYDKPHTSKEVKVPLPTSDITPPTEEHELVYCFAKKCPEYDVSSHSEYVEDKNRSRYTEILGMDKTKKCKSKTHNIRLPDSDITPPPIDIDEEEPSSWCEFKNDERTGHRTAKPVALMEFLLKYWSKEGGTVLDPTMGSGSMGIACKKMNRKFIGIELNDDIYELAKKRIGV